jgi:hypothetical protein
MPPKREGAPSRERLAVKLAATPLVVRANDVRGQTQCTCHNVGSNACIVCRQTAAEAAPASPKSLVRRTSEKQWTLSAAQVCAFACG